MVSPRSLARGCALGSVPGIVGLALMAIVAGPSKGNAMVFLSFASIGGALGALTVLVLALVSWRRREAPTNGKRYSMVKGFFVGIVLGMNGLIFTAIFANCLGLDPGSKIRVDCELTRTVWLFFFASLFVLGGLLGAMTGWWLSLRQTRPA